MTKNLFRALIGRTTKNRQTENERAAVERRPPTNLKKQQIKHGTLPFKRFGQTDN